MRNIVIPLLVTIASLCSLLPATAVENTVLWQIGKVDDASTEFRNYQQANPEALVVPADWATRTDWQFMSKGLKASINPAMTIAFTLRTVPKYGVLFSFKLLNAQKNGEEMAVFSNGVMAGLIQLWGTADTGCPYPWKKTYQLYIPKEMLNPGENTLRFEAPRPIWSDAKSDLYIWWEWDYLRLEALAAPASEPIHGKMTYMGTTLTHSDHDFYLNDHTVALAPVAFEWLGIAYSGNTIRTNFWKDVTWQQPARLQYLQTLRALNMTAIMDYTGGGHVPTQPDYSIPQSIRDDLKTFFTTYGPYFQYYELVNEPTNFGDGIMAKNVNLAKVIDELKPAHVKLTAGGWAYNKKGGVPNGWEGDPAQRRLIEDLCQATNGHSYGFSYSELNGGSFCENLKTYQGVSDGWPKEYVNT
ncbi:MAG TPA: polysaccharide lyase family protein, partial [Armatimonadota bacterium]|nr:polysaccharide lyase family protein [Armatimonadota bacterium]